MQKYVVEKYCAYFFEGVNHDTTVPNSIQKGAPLRKNNHSLAMSSSTRTPSLSASNNEVAAIMSNIVAAKSQYKYRNENIIFILWIFNDSVRDSLLEEELVGEIEEAKASTVGSIHKKKKAMREVIKKRLIELDDYSCERCPVKLERLNFDVISRYLTSRKKKNSRYLSKPSYDGIRSALCHLYRCSNKTMCPEMEKKLKRFMSGMKRTVAKEKRDAGESLDEGKRPMSLEVYDQMCKILYEGEDDEFLFAHAFITLEWNLMARSDNVVNAHINHLRWDEDCIQFFFPISKSNQGGENSEVPWHVYANPHKPHLCPILAMSKYFFSNGLINMGDKVFPGEYQYERYLKIFHRIIKDNCEVFERLGVKPGDLGSHSTRKGAITLVSTGCTVSPPMPSICLRSCWSMGPVKDRYIHYEKAGDQFVGRSVTCLSSMTKDFACSPPYFDTTDADTGMDDFINNLVDDTLASSGDFTPPMRKIVKMCLATLCYHYDDLCTRLSEKNKLRSCPMFIQICQLQSLRRLAVVKYPWNKSMQTPCISGVPPHVLLMSEMESLKISLNEHRNSIINGMRNELDQRNIGGDSYMSTQILDKVNEVHERMLSVLNGTGGTAQQNQNELNEIFDYCFDDEVEEVATQNNSEEASGIPKTNNDQKIMLSWKNTSGGKFKLLPKNYVIPHMSLCNLVTMWYCGDKQNKIPPYKMLSASDFSHVKSGKQKLTHMRKMISYFKRAAHLINRNDLIKSHRSVWTIRDAVTLYESTVHLFRFPNIKVGKVRRFESISWKTFYNILSKRKGKLLGECESD